MTPYKKKAAPAAAGTASNTTFDTRNHSIRASIRAAIERLALWGVAAWLTQRGELRHV